MTELAAKLKELTEASGVPGQEQEVRELMDTYLQPLAEHIFSDQLGSIIGRKTGLASGPKIMMMAHMDEVGFMVSNLSEGGYVSFQPLGGWWSQVMLAQRVIIKTRKGDVIGVIGSKPPHLLSDEERDKVVKIKDMFIDVGATSRAHAKEIGIRLGDPIVPICPFTVMTNEKMYMGKALDNRAGCLVAVEVLKELQGQDHPNVVFSGATVQEEVGFRGAQTSTATVQPDVFIALDVSISWDSPGLADGNTEKSKSGSGPILFLYDGHLIPNTRLRDLIIDTAEEKGIPLQCEVFSDSGATDAGRAHLTGQGVPSIAICMPARYIHSHASIMHHDDLENTIQLLVAITKKLDQNTVDWIKDGRVRP